MSAPTDWTTGKSHSPQADINGPTLADIAREEQAASEKATEADTKVKRPFRPRRDRGWYEGSNVHYQRTLRTYHAHEDIAQLEQLIAVYEASTPRNRKERRLRIAVIRDAHHDIDQINDALRGANRPKGGAQLRSLVEADNRQQERAELRRIVARVDSERAE